MNRFGKAFKLAAALCAIALAALPLAAGSVVQVRIVSPDIGERTVKIDKGYMFTVPNRARPGFHLEDITDQLGDIYTPGQNIAVNYDLTLTYRWKGEPAPESDFTWRWSRGGVEISKYKGSGATVVIPETIDGEKVASIGRDAFSGCGDVVSITIPLGVEKIDGSAFENCFNLATVEIPGSVASIGGMAFANCLNLKRITLPSSVKKVDYYAFMGWRSSQTINIAGGTDQSLWDGSWAEGCEARIQVLP